MYFNRTESVRLSRSDLYERVWSKSAVQLAKEFGISDVAISKLCKKHNVPKPPLGYWARIQHGQKIRRPALPKISDENLETVGFQRSVNPTDQDEISLEALEKIAAEKEEGNTILEAQELIDVHPLVERTRRSLSSSAVDSRGIVRPRAKQCLDVAVGKANVDRAARILDALVKALEARGFAINVSDADEERTTTVDILGEPLRIGLSETTDCKKREPTAEQIAEEKRRGYAWYPNVYDYSPSGKLKLSILTGGYDNLRRNWNDLVHQRIENCLNKFIVALIKVAERNKADRVETQRRARIWEEERRQRAERERLIAEEKDRVDDLRSKASVWRTCEDLRGYVAAIERAAMQRDGSISTEKLGRWSDWAKAYIEQVDPIESSLRTFAKEATSDGTA